MTKFLNPKAIATPAAAGATVMFLVNSLALAFPGLPPRYLALAISLLVGALIVLKDPTSRRRVAERVVCWAITSLVIFAVGYGSTYAARAAVDAAHDGVGASGGAVDASRGKNASLLSLFLPSAYARDRGVVPPPAHAAGAAATDEACKPKAPLDRAQAENKRVNGELEKQKTREEEMRNRERNSFFKKW